METLIRAKNIKPDYKKRKPYEYRHTVCLEETNIVGNVYFVNHLKWQGRCRELFLKEHAPDVLEQFLTGLCLVTVSCSCTYLMEISPFDEITVQMRLKELKPEKKPNQDAKPDESLIWMDFEYWRNKSGENRLVALGDQKVTCMKRIGLRMKPAHMPSSLWEALHSFEK